MAVPQCFDRAVIPQQKSSISPVEKIPFSAKLTSRMGVHADAAGAMVQRQNSGSSPEVITDFSRTPTVMRGLRDLPRRERAAGRLSLAALSWGLGANKAPRGSILAVSAAWGQSTRITDGPQDQKIAALGFVPRRYG